jgi:hypothetical protein
MDRQDAAGHRHVDGPYDERTGVGALLTRVLLGHRAGDVVSVLAPGAPRGWPVTILAVDAIGAGRERPRSRTSTVVADHAPLYVAVASMAALAALHSLALGGVRSG